MEKRIMFSMFGMAAVTAFVGIVITTFVCYSFFRKEVRDNLANKCRLVACCYDNLGAPEELARFKQENFRITLIKEDGTVLYESESNASKMGNHLGRPEITEAIAKGTGSDTRYSSITGTENYYYAEKLTDGNILRVSTWSGLIFILFGRSIMIILTVTICLVIASMVVSAILTNNLIAPLKRIPRMLENNEAPDETGIYPEIIPLVKEIKNARSEQELMRQEFTANVSHELKTPLTSISGYAELIETGMAKGDVSVKFAGYIRNECARLITLISDILRLSELDAVTPSSLDDMIDLGSVAQECKERLAVQAEQKGISVSIRGNSKPIKGNHGEITELVYNLIDNAIKYNRENGGIDVVIQGKSISITDTGIGIPKECIPRIFERFYRVDKSRSRAGGGTGLGLSIVKHIADRHNARIIVESEERVGTTVTVNFR